MIKELDPVVLASGRHSFCRKDPTRKTSGNSTRTGNSTRIGSPYSSVFG